MWGIAAKIVDIYVGCIPWMWLGLAGAQCSSSSAFFDKRPASEMANARSTSNCSEAESFRMASCSAIDNLAFFQYQNSLNHHLGNFFFFTLS